MIVDWPTVVSMIRAVLEPIASAAWPIAVALIFFQVRLPLQQLIGRVKSLSGWGASVDVMPRQDTQTRQLEAVETGGAPVNSSGLVLYDPVYDPFDNTLRDWIENSVHGDDGVKLKFAIRQRSISEVARLHEFHYRYIFGSQIRALILLNQVEQAPVEHFRQIYETQVLPDPANAVIHAGRTFEQWGEYLVNTGYVAVEETSEPPLVRITPLGRHFCAWLGITGASQAKPG